MTVVLRDDFNGDGLLLGRTPDGINSGAWVNDPFQNGGSTFNAPISAGRLESNTAQWGSYAPLSGDPADAYAELRVIDANSSQTNTIALRYDPNVNSGVFLEFYRSDPNQITMTLQTVNTPSMSGTTSGSFDVANGADVLLRLDLSGQQISVYLDGVLCLFPVLDAAMSGGSFYIGSNFASAKFDYVEVNAGGADTGGIVADGTIIYKWNAGTTKMRYQWTGKLWLLTYPQGFNFVRARAKDYDDLTLEFYADGVLLFTKVVTDSKPFRLPVREDYDQIQWIARGTSRVYSVEVADDVTELS